MRQLFLIGSFSASLIVFQDTESSGDEAVARQQLANNLPLKHFLDGLFLDKVKGLTPATLKKAQVSPFRVQSAKVTLFSQVLLVDVLIARLTVATPPPSSSTPFQLYGSRHKWLDSLLPFDGPAPKPSQVTLQDLMQLQALLCHTQPLKPAPAGHVTSPRGRVTSSGDHMTVVARHVEECMVEGMLGELSLKLLTWPHTGKLKQVGC